MEVAPRAARWQRRLWSALLAWSVWSCSAPELPRTEVVVVVDTDLALGEELDALRIEITGPGETAQSSSAELDADSALPQTLGLVHERGARGPIRVLALGLLDGREVLRREAELSFIDDKTLTLPMHLVRACVAHACGEAQTCSEHGCVSSEVDATRLAEWHGRPPTLAEPDEPPPLPEDAGEDGQVSEADGSSELDAGTPDAETGDPDAQVSKDAGGDGESDAQVSDAGATEDGGMCMPQVESCNEADDDCDGVIDNGYDLTTDTRHCGVCNMRCSQPTSICCKGTCARNCQN
jgi:hypothetical protein